MVFQCLDTPIELTFSPTKPGSETEIAFTSLNHVYYTFSGECMFHFG